MSWTKVFRAGTYPQGVFTATELDEVVHNYDATDPAPLVIGHPKVDSPAFGWIAALRRDGDTLLAQFSEVVDEAKELVTKGLYRKLSVRLRREDGRGWTLRHVGLLGAHPPAVAGLGPINFGEAGEGVGLEVDFTEETRMDEAQIRAEERAKVEAEFAAQKTALERELQVERMKTRRKDTEAFIAKHVGEGRLTPAMRDAGLADFMLTLDEGAEVEFAEGTKSTARGFFEAFVAQLPKTVEFGEQFGARSDGGRAEVDFGAEKGTKLDADRAALHRKAVEYQRTNKCSYEAAIAAVA